MKHNHKYTQYLQSDLILLHNDKLAYLPCDSELASFIPPDYTILPTDFKVHALYCLPEDEHRLTILLCLSKQLENGRIQLLMQNIKYHGSYSIADYGDSLADEFEAMDDEQIDEEFRRWLRE